MSTTLNISTKTSTLKGNLAPVASRLALGLEGRKTWLSPNSLRFETSRSNVDLVTSLLPTGVVQDERSQVDEGKLFDLGERQPSTNVEPRFRFKPYGFQQEIFERFKDKDVWALFSVQGSGKTKSAFDIICHRYLCGTVTGVIVLSSPKGVHAQWIDEQMPRHLWENVPTKTLIWDGRKPPEWIGTETQELQVISGNIDMLRGNGFKLLQTFANQHKHRLFIIVDESDSIKNHNAQRSKRLRELAAATRQRAIMTGTPIAKDLTDEFSQFYFLDPDIIGHKYVTSFRAQYCIMGGFENRSVVGHKNVEKFKQITAPHIFRATKDDLGLPPKVYDDVVFELTSEQKRLMREIRETFYAQLEDGSATKASSGAVALMRMQQISNGFIVDEEGNATLIDNPRMDALVGLRKSIQGPVVIWCRFKQDIELVKRQFPNGATYFGETTGPDRQEAKRAFINGEVSELIATPGAAGRGLDGLQEVCTDAIYYSNSFNAIDRWQSEDRIDRLGGIGTATYFDLIARGSVDRRITNNLKHKQSISSMALDGLKEIMDELV